MINPEFQLLDGIQQFFGCQWLDAVMPGLSSLGDAGICWIVLSILLLLFPRTRRAGFASAAALIFMLVGCNMILKPLVARPRPFAVRPPVRLLLPEPRDFSFPSGHSCASFASATAVWKNSRRIGFPALALACLIAFSRLYLYVHYPTDVLAGILLGIAFGYLGNLTAAKIMPRKNNGAP